MADFSPTIGKISGIPIELHWTFLLLLLFILFLNLYLFVIWVLLFICVLIHELVHSITSRRNNIKVKKIVLYPFGGGSIIDFENVNPNIEFRISIVGPISSLLLAVIFGLIAIYYPPGIVESTLQTLFLLNAFLGIFNLLPWLPLDGGRALRSYLQKGRNFLEATKVAVKTSNAVTVLFIIGTLIYVAVAQNQTLFYKEFFVIFDVAIAIFIYGGAQAELQSAYLKENTKNLKAKDAINSNYVFVKPDTKVSELYAILTKKKTHIVLFRKNESIQVFSNLSLQKKKSTDDSKVANFGITVPSIPYNLNLYDAVQRMRNDDKNIAAVVKHGKIIGILLMQHVESMITLHTSNKKRTRQTNK